MSLEALLLKGVGLVGQAWLLPPIIDDPGVLSPDLAMRRIADLHADEAKTDARDEQPDPGLLMQIHPALERVLGPHLDHPAVLDLLQKYPTPTAMLATGLARLGTRLLKFAPRIGRRLAEEIFRALAEQTVVVGGTNAMRAVLPHLAAQLAALRRQRADIAVEVAALVADHPLEPITPACPESAFEQPRASSRKF